MKKLLLAALPILMLSACNKCDDRDLRVNTFSATVGSGTWNANEISWITVNDQLQLEGRQGTRKVQLLVPDYKGKGYYRLGTNVKDAIYRDGETEFVGDAGSVTVSSDDCEVLKGSYSFDGSAMNGQKKKVSGTFTLYR